MRIAVWAIVAACSGKSATPEVPANGKCAVDDDCVISCEVKGDCCHNPFCENVQLRAVAQAAEAANAKDCTDAQRQHCPVVGGIQQPTYRVVPRCRAGACIGEKQPFSDKKPASPEIVDTSGFQTDCKTVADCKIVKADPCNHCACANVAIAAREAARFAEAAQAITCGPREPIRCGECRGFVADCVGGKCTAKPEL